MKTETPKTYDPSTVETKWYDFWMERRCFESDPDERTPYTIVIPPPNVTGVLHMGHMLNNTLQDVLVRRKRLLGFNACWVPGTDHASIATEAKVVALLREQGVKKSDLTREQFLEHAWAWKEKYGGIILKQLKKLGASCDWRRTRFTMEPSLSEAVMDVFVDLYRKGYIYRGLRMVNWDPAGKTAVSDEEVLREDTPGKLYYVRYAVDGAPNTWITIATTRPETILADTGIAVHPDDERYKDLIGKTARVPFIERQIPIIADAYVDSAFGTGCLKVTPAHDVNDYEIGLRHKLPVIDILNEDGTISEKAGRYIGEDRFAARVKIVADLTTAGHLIKTEEIVHSVGYSERTRAVIEPRLSLQWFVRMQEISKPALDAVLNSEGEGVRLIPQRFVNTYRYWMENVRDWCISRQLWWGHRIPAYYYTAPDGTDAFAVAASRAEAFAAAQAAGFTGMAGDLRQDDDVLDTWFSSWLWPISVFDGFKDPNNADIKYYYPTDDLVTAPEILFFWVARMIIAGYEYRGERPFKNVYLTGIVRDKLGRKMSKSLGNSPDPLDLIEKYGADGVRVGMLLCSPAGNDLPFDESLCEQGRNFSNKIWNAFRLMQSLSEQIDDAPQSPIEILALRWLGARLDEAALATERLFEQFRVSEALMTVYKLTWDDFCSWFLELIKPQENKISLSAYNETILYFERLLQLLHPFMPFLTEEIASCLRERTGDECLATSQMWTPQPPSAEILKEMTEVREITASIRALRAEKNLSMKNPIDLTVCVQNGETKFFQTYAPILTRFTRARSLDLTKEKPGGAYPLVVLSYELFIQGEGENVFDAEAERKKIQEEIDYTRDFLKGVDAKLSNEKFVQNAKPDVLARERQKKQDAEARLSVLQNSLNNITA